MPVADFEPNAFRTLALLTKSCVWSHEQEYRLINMPITLGKQERILDNFFKWKTPQLAVIHPSLIVGVTIGAFIRDAEIENILRICHDRPIKIPVFKAKCGQDRFDLEFERITEPLAQRHT